MITPERRTALAVSESLTSYAALIHAAHLIQKDHANAAAHNLLLRMASASLSPVQLSYSDAGAILAAARKPYDGTTTIQPPPWDRG